MLLSQADAVASLVTLSAGDAVAVAAGLSDALSRACNRVFARYVESITADGTTTVVTSFRHGLSAGDRVSIATEGGSSPLDGSVQTVAATNLTLDTFEIASAMTSAEATAIGSATMRPVVDEVHRTRCVDSIFVQCRPLAEVVSLETHDGSQSYTTVAATDYSVVGPFKDGVSLSGEVALLEDQFPDGSLNGRWDPIGAKISYVAGEPTIPSGVEYLMTNMLNGLYGRLTASGFQSENIDYYSYSRLSTAEIGTLFGEADQIIKSYRIAA
ncbi:MAG: hypothetical protein AAGJ40_09445 [Planctomycetota bacterium]